MLFGKRPYSLAVAPQGNIGKNIHSVTFKLLISGASFLARDVDIAIQACTQEKMQLLPSRDNMGVIRKPSDESYCDISGAHCDLELIGIF